MSNTYFQFKQFRIDQSRCAMKVGTDGVLLGAWASMAGIVGPLRPTAPGLPPLQVLDIGTGTGLLALMLAQRAASREWGRRAFSVTAVEREAAAAAQARENVSASPWASMVTVVTADIRTWRPAGTGDWAASAGATDSGVSAAPDAEVSAAPAFDLIVCNPPFFTDSLKGPDAARNAARHDDYLKSEELFRLAAALLKPAPAAFNLVLPADKEAVTIEIAARYGLMPARLCRVFTAPRATVPNRVLAAFVRHDGGCPEIACPSPGSAPSRLTGLPPVETLRLYQPPTDAVAAPRYTPEYRALVQPFYLDK